jgi:hypothetical protein
MSLALAVEAVCIDREKEPGTYNVLVADGVGPPLAEASVWQV